MTSKEILMCWNKYMRLAVKDSFKSFVLLYKTTINLYQLIPHCESKEERQEVVKEEIMNYLKRDSQAKESLYALDELAVFVFGKGIANKAQAHKKTVSLDRISELLSKMPISRMPKA